MPSFGRALRTFLWGRSGMRTPLRRLYESLLESEWWPADRLAGLQRRQLVSLLSHARTSSPFYRYRLNAVMRPDGSIDWGRWSRLPIVTRSELSHSFSAMLTRSPVRAHGPFADMTTSGSTGDPVKVRSTGWMSDLVAACNWRSQHRHGLDWSSTLLNRVAVEVPGLKAGDPTGPWGPPWDRVAARGQTIFLPRDGTIGDHYQAIRSYRPDFATVGAVFLSDLASMNDAQPIPVELGGFLARGSAVTTARRQAAKASFGAEVLELYSSKEAGPIAHPCPLDPAVLHVNDEALLLEVVDEAGFPSPPGTLGRVVITPFASTALPLIRYDQGDLAVAGPSCACGRGLSTLRQVAGRTYDLFRHPDGRVMSALQPLDGLRAIIGARRWQVAQVGPRSYQVRLPKRSDYQQERFAEFLEKARAALFGDATIEIVLDCEAATNQFDKFKEMVNEWNPTGAN